MKINQSTPPYKQKTYHHPPMVNVYTPYNIPFFSVAPQPRSFCLWQKAWKCGKEKKKVINRTVDNFVDKLFLKTIHSRLLKDFDVKSLAELFWTAKTFAAFSICMMLWCFLSASFKNFLKKNLIVPIMFILIKTKTNH